MNLNYFNLSLPSHFRKKEIYVWWNIAKWNASKFAIFWNMKNHAHIFFLFFHFLLLSHLEYISLQHFIKHEPLIYEVCLLLKRIFYWIRHVDHARIFLPSLAALKSEISSWRKKIRRAKHSCVELFLNKFIGTTILKNTNLIKLFKYYTGTNLCNSTFVFRYTVRYTTIYCIPETYLKDNRKFVKSFHPILGFVLY